MIKKLLATVLLALTLPAFAATYYVDRHIPVGPPCMVTVGFITFNATVIKQIEVGEGRVMILVKDERWYVPDVSEYQNRYIMRVTFVDDASQTWYADPDRASVDGMHAKLLADIKACR